LVDPEGVARPISDEIFRILEQVANALAAGGHHYRSAYHAPTLRNLVDLVDGYQRLSRQSGF
jgi:hypothetical protein